MLDRVFVKSMGMALFHCMQAKSQKNLLEGTSAFFRGRLRFFSRNENFVDTNEILIDNKRIVMFFGSLAASSSGMKFLKREPEGI